jgi:hypothetical protein
MLCLEHSMKHAGVRVGFIESSRFVQSRKTYASLILNLSLQRLSIYRMLFLAYEARLTFDRTNKTDGLQQQLHSNYTLLHKSYTYYRYELTKQCNAFGIFLGSASSDWKREETNHQITLGCDVLNASSRSIVTYRYTACKETDVH